MGDFKIFKYVISKPTSVIHGWPVPFVKLAAGAFYQI